MQQKRNMAGRARVGIYLSRLDQLALRQVVQPAPSRSYHDREVSQSPRQLHHRSVVDLVRQRAVQMASIQVASLTAFPRHHLCLHRIIAPRRVADVRVGDPEAHVRAALAKLQLHRLDVRDRFLQARVEEVVERLDVRRDNALFSTNKSNKRKHNASTHQWAPRQRVNQCAQHPAAHPNSIAQLRRRSSDGCSRDRRKRTHGWGTRGCSGSQARTSSFSRAFSGTSCSAKEGTCSLGAMADQLRLCLASRLAIASDKRLWFLAMLAHAGYFPSRVTWAGGGLDTTSAAHSPAVPAAIP